MYFFLTNTIDHCTKKSIIVLFFSAQHTVPDPANVVLFTHKHSWCDQRINSHVTWRLPTVCLVKALQLYYAANVIYNDDNFVRKLNKRVIFKILLFSFYGFVVYSFVQLQCLEKIKYRTFYLFTSKPENLFIVKQNKPVNLYKSQK